MATARKSVYLPRIADILNQGEAPACKQAENRKKPSSS